MMNVSSLIATYNGLPKPVGSEGSAAHSPGTKIQHYDN